MFDRAFVSPNRRLVGRFTSSHSPHPSCFWRVCVWGGVAHAVPHSLYRRVLGAGTWRCCRHSAFHRRLILCICTAVDFGWKFGTRAEGPCGGLLGDRWPELIGSGQSDENKFAPRFRTGRLTNDQMINRQMEQIAMKLNKYSPPRAEC